LQDQIDDNKKLIEKKRECVETLKKVEEKKRLLEDQKNTLREATSRTKQLEKEIGDLEKKLKDASGELKKLEDLKKRLAEVDRRVKRAEETLKQVSGQVLSLKVKIQEGESRIKDLEKEVKTKEESVRKSELLREYVIWVDDYFAPTLENIERHVLITINQEFNNYFQHWFSMLVVDPTKDARVDEDFTPIVEQDGVEQNVQYLSGGERTSVALAYRLALNTMVRKVSTGIRSNLLILDEPTDGFSKDQLFRIQDILGELECPQIIMVSHEKELESFADQVFKVSKTNGTSRVTA
jgi:exonuclease SbcC